MFSPETAQTRSLPATAGAKLGIDANRPIDPVTGLLNPHLRDLHVLSDTGAGWVRLNFVLGPWSDPLDRTRHGGQTWREAYGTLIEGLGALGLKLYGLIGAEAVNEDPGDRFRQAPASGALQDAWLDKYVANFCAIAALFHSDFQAFESFNEPDDWHGQARPWVHPAWFAVILQRIHAAVHDASGLDRVKLVSGPLQGLEQNKNSAVGYLRETYKAGKKFFGWGQSGSPFPFDGIGYHVYVAQAYSASVSSHQRTVRAVLACYLNQMHQLVRGEEGADKPLYVSEAGWRSNLDLKAIQAREAFQAQALTAGLDTLARDPLVELGVWFCTQDFYTGSDPTFYGLYRLGEVGPAARKPAYAAFQAACRQSLAPAQQTTYTNQAILNAFYYAAADLGLADGSLLVKKAGLSLATLVANRQGPYCGLSVDRLPNLTASERQLILQKLAAGRSIEPTVVPDADRGEREPEDRLIAVVGIGAIIAFLLVSWGVAGLLLLLVLLAR